MCRPPCSLEHTPAAVVLISAHPQPPLLDSQVAILPRNRHGVPALLLQPLPLAFVPSKVPHRDCGNGSGGSRVEAL